MLRPDVFGGVASHAGGGLFEVSIRPFFREAVRTLRDLYGGSVEHGSPTSARGQRQPGRTTHLLLQ